MTVVIITSFFRSSFIVFPKTIRAWVVNWPLPRKPHCGTVSSQEAGAEGGLPPGTSLHWEGEGTGEPGPAPTSWSQWQQSGQTWRPKEFNKQNWGHQTRLTCTRPQEHDLNQTCSLPRRGSLFGEDRHINDSNSQSKECYPGRRHLGGALSKLLSRSKWNMKIEDN